MIRRISLVLTVLLALTMVPFALADEAADAPIQVVSSALKRTSSSGLAMIPLEGAMTFLYNNVTDSSGRLGEAPENLMYYSISYTMDESKECLIKLVLTGPDGAVERENTLPLGNAEGENGFAATMLAASGVNGEYTAELYIDGILLDTATFSD